MAKKRKKLSESDYRDIEIIYQYGPVTPDQIIAYRAFTDVVVARAIANVDLNVPAVNKVEEQESA